MKLKAAPFVLATALLFAAAPARAQSGEFHNMVEAYLMGAAMSGTVGVGQAATEIDIPASSILSNLKFAALVDYRGEAKGWALSADVVYMHLGAAGTTDRGRVSADVGAAELLVDAVGYRLLDQDYESGSGSDTFTWNVLTQGPLVAAGVTF